MITHLRKALEAHAAPVEAGKVAAQAVIDRTRQPSATPSSEPSEQKE